MGDSGELHRKGDAEKARREGANDGSSRTIVGGKIEEEAEEEEEEGEEEEEEEGGGDAARGGMIDVPGRMCGGGGRGGATRGPSGSIPV